MRPNSMWLLVCANYSSVNIVMWVNEELWVTNCYLWCCNTQWWPLSTHQLTAQCPGQGGWVSSTDGTNRLQGREVAWLMSDHAHIVILVMSLSLRKPSLDNICWLSPQVWKWSWEPSVMMCQLCQPHTESEGEEMITLWREKSFARSWWHRVWGGQILFIGVRRSHIWGDIGRGGSWCQHWLSIPTVMTRSYRERGYSDQ